VLKTIGPGGKLLKQIFGQCTLRGKAKGINKERMILGRIKSSCRSKTGFYSFLELWQRLGRCQGVGQIPPGPG